MQIIRLNQDGQLYEVSDAKADAFVGAALASRTALTKLPGSIVNSLEPKPVTKTFTQSELPSKQSTPLPGEERPDPIVQMAGLPTGIDPVHPDTGFDLDVEVFEKRGFVTPAKPKPLLPPAPVPSKSAIEPILSPSTLPRPGQTLSTGAAVRRPSLPPNVRDLRYVNRLPGGETVPAPRSGPDDPGTMPGGLRSLGIRFPNLVTRSPVQRFVRGAVPIALNVACRLLSKGRVPPAASKALCGYLAARAKRALK